MRIKFTKMQGAGNDYIYVNCLDEPVLDPTRLAADLSDRRFGIGGDGLVLIETSDRADFRMRIFNADGSEAEICGNASRCVGRYLYDNRLLKGQAFFNLETRSGIRKVFISVENGNPVPTIRVEMGVPRMGGDTGVPLKPMIVSGTRYDGREVSMGNPHFVVFRERITDKMVLEHGPLIENHPRFPDRTNVEFARILNRSKFAFRVWERGSGETLSCGSGACAVFAAARAEGLVESLVVCQTPGGELTVEEGASGRIILGGSAEKVFDGIYEA